MCTDFDGRRASPMTFLAQVRCRVVCAPHRLDPHMAHTFLYKNFIHRVRESLWARHHRLIALASLFNR